MSDDELAQIDLESSLLARERHRNADATEALAKARQHLAAYLSQPTPVIGEIDSALAAARRSRQPARPANTVLTRGLLSQRH